MKPKLIFEHRDSETVRLLQRGFQGHSQLDARVLKPFGQKPLPDLDAFYVSLMAAERLGMTVRPVAHQAQVFRTRQEDRGTGWPPFVVAGLALKAGENPFDARLGLPLIIRAVIKAVKDFNAQAAETIRTVGFESGWTGIDELPPQEAAQIIRAVYDETPE